MIVCIVGIGGLCNRMRTMAGAIKLAREWSTKVVFLWITMPDMNAPFHTLFNDIEGCRVIDIKARRSVFRLLNIVKRCWKGSVITDDIVYKYFKGKDRGQIYREKIAGQNLLLWTCENITDAKDFSMFRPIDEIEKKTSECIDKDTIGVHIRRSDNEQSRKYSPTELFVERMTHEIEENTRCKFYLATDDIEEEQYLKALFGSRVVAYKKRSLDRNNPLGIEDALIDLYNLSKCNRILGSYCSSFSDVAAGWGKIEKMVVCKKQNW